MSNVKSSVSSTALSYHVLKKSMTFLRPLAQQCLTVSLFQFSNSICALQIIIGLNVVLMCFTAEIEQCENSGGSCVRVVLVCFFNQVGLLVCVSFLTALGRFRLCWCW